MAGPPDDFEKVENSDNAMYGPRGLLACGFNADEQQRLLVVLMGAGLGDLGFVWADETRTLDLLGDLLTLPGGTGQGNPSGLPRAVIMSGITENELHRLMAAYRGAGLERPLWATLTPTSEAWTLQALLQELAAERKAMAEQLRNQ